MNVKFNICCLLLSLIAHVNWQASESLLIFSFSFYSLAWSCHECFTFHLIINLIHFIRIASASTHSRRPTTCESYMAAHTIISENAQQIPLLLFCANMLMRTPMSFFHELSLASQDWLFDFNQIIMYYPWTLTHSIPAWMGFLALVELRRLYGMVTRRIFCSPLRPSRRHRESSTTLKLQLG